MSENFDDIISGVKNEDEKVFEQTSKEIMERLWKISEDIDKLKEGETRRWKARPDYDTDIEESVGC